MRHGAEEGEREVLSADDVFVWVGEGRESESLCEEKEGG